MPSTSSSRDQAAASARRQRAARAARRQEQKADTALATVEANRRQRQAARADNDPATAIISSVPKAKGGTLADGDDWKFTREQLHPGRPKAAKAAPSNVGMSSTANPELFQEIADERPATRRKERAEFRDEGASPAELRKLRRLQDRAGEIQRERVALLPGTQVRQPQIKAEALRRVRRARKAVRRTGGVGAVDLPHLDPEQEKVARQVLGVGKKRKVSYRELLAATETGLVESDFRNLDYGDADSEGWRQERTSLYPTGADGPTNVKAAANRFFDESASDTGGARGKGQTAGELAQTIQASAYPGKYDERKQEAKAILNAFLKGGADPQKVRNLRAAEAAARELGVRLDKGGKVRPSKKTVKRFKAIDFYATKLEEGEVPYDYGGGHEVGTPKNPAAGLDCSSSTVWVLRKAGVKIPNIVSGEFGNYLPAGPGAVTIFYNSGHVFMRIGDRYYGTSRSNPMSGPGFIEEGYDESYLSQYNVAHVPGLGEKAAIELGFELPDAGSGSTSGGSFPGMTLSSDGTTATINPGGGVKRKGKAGFSKQPISPLQKYNRNKRELRQLGVPLGGKKKVGGGGAHPILQELKEKYGSKPPAPTAIAERRTKAAAAASR